MSEIRMTGEIRTDYDCESTGMPAERWGEAVFKINEEELVINFSGQELTYKVITAEVVDDEKKVVELLKETIKKISNGYSILAAYNGKEALEVIEKEKVDLLLLDIKMPVMSGVQVLTELHNRKMWLPTMILTAYNVKEMEAEFQEFGIVDYLTKPLDLVHLKKRIEEEWKTLEKSEISGFQHTLTQVRQR